ncbi:MAG: alpha/beta fold hydrolase, partial [Rectinemataceae bacterium]|nr:alpha/beta fold hydrolase [Rectinemataceae bacterium]
VRPEKLAAWFKKPEEGFPTLAFFHGNAGHLGDLNFLLEAFADQRFGIGAVSYPGFGTSTGVPSEKALYRAGDALIREMHREHGTLDKVVPVGFSMGGAVALHVATKNQFPAQILLAPFSSFVELAKKKYPYIPAHSMLEHRFENNKKIRLIDSPTRIYHGDQDEVTSYHHSLRLQQLGGEKVSLRIMPGASHKQLPLDIVIDDIQHFLSCQGICPPPQPQFERDSDKEERRPDFLQNTIIMRAPNNRTVVDLRVGRGADSQKINNGVSSDR